MIDFKIVPLGYGGAWDYAEGNSAFLISTGDNPPVLVDCGSTVHEKLLKYVGNSRDIIDNNHIIITHTHEDHVGSLSNNIYYRYFQALMREENAHTVIIAAEHVQPLIRTKLKLINNHSENQFTIKPDGVYENLGLSLAFVNTTSHHFEVFPTSGIIMRNAKGEYCVISGDINVPIFTIIQTQFPLIYKEMEANPERVVILHDATVYDYEKNPHCFYKKLLPYKKKFPYIYTYHHDNGQMEALNQVGWVNFVGDFLNLPLKIG